MSKTIDLYSDKDMERATNALRKALVAFFVVAAVTIAALVTMLIIRNLYIAVIATIIGAWGSYFLFMNKALPWIRYRRFLRDMAEGLSRSTDGWFVSIAEKPRQADGVSVHDMILRVGDEEEDERLFLWDDDKELPKLEEGDAISVVSFSNFVKELRIE